MYSFGPVAHETARWRSDFRHGLARTHGTRQALDRELSDEVYRPRPGFPFASSPEWPRLSIQTTGGFLHISNAPNEAGGCIASVPAAPAGAGVRSCGEHLVYVTAIPTSVAGILFGTVEKFGEDDALIGVTSTAQADADAIPLIGLDALCGA